MTVNSRTIVDDILGTRPSLNRINSKNKGNRNEVVAAKWLEKWTGEGFARTPSSGGLRWGADAAFACGDVVCKNQNFDFKFAIETKHLKAVEFKAYLSKRSKVYTIFQQAQRDADRAGKLPMLMLRTNGMDVGKFHIFMRSREMTAFFEAATQQGTIKRQDEIEVMVGSYEGEDREHIIIGVPSDFILQVPYKKFAERIEM